MSDASQGQGWWIASDGRWYPPPSPPVSLPAPLSVKVPPSSVVQPSADDQARLASLPAPPPGVQRGSLHPEIPIAEAQTRPKKKNNNSSKWIAFAVALAVIITVIIAVGTRGTDVTQTQSYKDGLVAGGTLGAAYDNDLAVFGTSIESFCEGVSGENSFNNNEGADNRSEWTLGCVQGLKNLR